jgi:YggT family protein
VPAYAFVQIVQIVFSIFNLLILARILMGWFNLDPYHPIAQFLYKTTEPFLAPVRRLLPQTGMLDFSPIIVIILAQVLQTILIQLVI